MFLTCYLYSMGIILKVTNNWASSIFRPPNQHLDSFLGLFLSWTHDLLLLDHDTGHRVQRDASCSRTLGPKGCIQTACYGTQVQKDYFSCQLSKAARCWMKKVDMMHNLHIWIYTVQIQPLSLSTESCCKEPAVLGSKSCLHIWLSFLDWRHTSDHRNLCIRMSADSYGSIGKVTPPFYASVAPST